MYDQDAHHINQHHTQEYNLESESQQFIESENIVDIAQDHELSTGQTQTMLHMDVEELEEPTNIGRSWCGTLWSAAKRNTVSIGTCLKNKTCNGISYIKQKTQFITIPKVTCFVTSTYCAFLTGVLVDALFKGEGVLQDNRDYMRMNGVMPNNNNSYINYYDGGVRDRIPNIGATVYVTLLAYAPASFVMIKKTKIIGKCKKVVVYTCNAVRSTNQLLFSMIDAIPTSDFKNLPKIFFNYTYNTSSIIENTFMLNNFEKYTRQLMNSRCIHRNRFPMDQFKFNVIVAAVDITLYSILMNAIQTNRANIQSIEDYMRLMFNLDAFENIDIHTLYMTYMVLRTVLGRAIPVSLNLFRIYRGTKTEINNSTYSPQQKQADIRALNQATKITIYRTILPQTPRQIGTSAFVFIINLSENPGLQTFVAIMDPVVSIFSESITKTNPEMPPIPR